MFGRTEVLARRNFRIASVLSWIHSLLIEYIFFSPLFVPFFLSHRILLFVVYSPLLDARALNRPEVNSLFSPACRELSPIGHSLRMFCSCRTWKFNENSNENALLCIGRHSVRSLCLTNQLCSSSELTGLDHEPRVAREKKARSVRRSAERRQTNIGLYFMGKYCD